MYNNESEIFMFFWSIFMLFGNARECGTDGIHKWFYF